MAVDASTSPNINQMVSIQTLFSDCYRISSDICRTCFLVKDNLSMFCIDSIKLNALEITLREKLSCCCPELDLRISSKEKLCVNCFETICTLYEFTHKFDQTKRQFHENFSFAFPTIDSSLFENYHCTKHEIKTEEVDLCDIEKDNSSKFTQVQIQQVQYNSKASTSIHTREKTFKCSVCDYGSTIIPTGEKPFKCSVCDFTSTRKNNLKSHLFIHTGEKPFKCSVCNFAFTRKHHLKRHLLIHTVEKPFKCSQCNYGCKRKSYLKNHFYIHIKKKLL